MRGPTIWPNIIASVALCAMVAGSSLVARVQGAVPLSVRLSAIQMLGPGRLRIDATISGLEPELRATIQQTMTLGTRTHVGRPFPVVGPRMPYAVDLPSGAVRIGGVLFDEVAPVAPLEENTFVSFTVTVRQGNDRVTAAATDLLLLPTVVVPGYLNDLGGATMNTGAVSALERRGFRAGGASPTLFWFSYKSRTLSVEAAAQELAAYVRMVVLPDTYAAKINLVAYSLGGILARWDMATQPGWDRLINRFVMIAVPNEGAVLSYVDAWYPLGGLARTPAARGLLPTFPFWRARPDAAWTIPPDSANPVLDELNAHPLPRAVRAYAFYGVTSHSGSSAPDTLTGLTGALPQAGVSYAPGDGIVLAASVLGLPVNGGTGYAGSPTGSC
jgi:hypothetical protein